MGTSSTSLWVLNAAVPKEADDDMVFLENDDKTFPAHWKCTRLTAFLHSSGNPRSDFFSSSEPVDLQLDYWTSSEQTSSGAFSSSPFGSSSRHHRGDSSGGLRGSDSKKGGVFGGEAKSSIKSSIRYMLIQRTVANAGTSSEEPGANAFTMQYWVKEKKQKSELKRFY